MFLFPWIHPCVLCNFTFLCLWNKNYQRVEFELTQQIQGCLLSPVNTFTISYGYHNRVILSSKLLHCKTTPGVQHLQLSFVFCKMPPFLPESLETPPPPGDNVISYIMLFSLCVQWRLIKAGLCSVTSLHPSLILCFTYKLGLPY